ncbi:MAG: hypothetical protein AB7L66_09405 [Gemmatimonadales bacterium]
MRFVPPALLLLAAACHPAAPPPADLLTLEVEEQGADLLLTLRPAPGARINALAKPTLELADGRRVTLQAAALTADSAYFADLPTARLPDTHRVEGILRAGVCPEGLAVCQTVAIPVEHGVGAP